MRGHVSWAPVAWAVAVGLVATALLVPTALRGGSLSPDSIEHLAIAHAWTQGAGFVDPVQWHYFLDRGPPLPAAAVRPPLVPLLAALPLALGATIPTVILLHAAVAAGVAVAMFLVGVRRMRPPAAAAAALLLVTMPAWRLLSSNPLTEVVATACYLLVLLTADGVLRSARGAVWCAAVTLVAALARPNLGAVAAAVVAAAIWEVGGRHALRRRSLWVYGLSFAGSVMALDLLLRAAAGAGLYAGYGVVTELLSLSDAWHYDREPVGTWTFVSTHADEIMRIVQHRVVQLSNSLFLSRDFHRVGWLAVPAVVYAMRRPRDGVLAQRIDAFAIVGFFAATITYYSAYAHTRFPLPIAVPSCLAGMAALDAAARRIETAFGRWSRMQGGWRLGVLGRLPGLAPLGVVLALWVLVPLRRVPSVLPSAWARYRVARQGGPRRTPAARELRDLCARLDPDAVVAASFPWDITFWCGNATVRLPIDPVSAVMRDRFVAERGVGYLVLDQRPRPLTPEHTARWRAVLDHSTRFRRLPAPGPFHLYQVLDGPRSRPPWRAPGPVVCAGRPRGCAPGTPAGPEARPNERARPVTRRERSAPRRPPAPRP